MNLLAIGNAFLAKQLTQSASTPVLYSDGAITIPTSATIGQSDFTEENDEAITNDVRTRDYLIDAATLRAAGIVEPEPGDVVIEPIPGTGNGQHYEVLRVAGNKCWRWLDTSEIKMRIHTKRIGVRPLP